MFIIRINITHDDSKEDIISIKKYLGSKILNLLHVICFHFFKRLENKESAKILWVGNYKQDSNFVFLKPCVYIIYIEQCVLVKPFFSLQQSSLGIYRL